MIGTRVTGMVCVSTLLFGCGSPPDPERPGNAAVPTEQAAETYQVQRSAGAALSLVYRAQKPEELVLLELYNDKVVFTALVSRRKFEEVMVLKPPTYFSYEGSDYVRNDGLLFWGKVGKPESVSVDGAQFHGFALANDSQISAEGEAARTALEAMKSRSRLKLEKHYWNSKNEKAFPSFDLAPVRDKVSTLSSSSASTFSVSEKDARCRQEGPRKIVWLESSEGSYALNGQATDLVEKSAASGTPWRDARGRPLHVGRDVLGVQVTTALIEAGLRKCK